MGGFRFQANLPLARRMIVFFPTYACRTPQGWRATVAGMVTRPLPERSRRRTLAIAVFKRLLDLEESQFDTEIFRRRAESFLFQRVAGRRLRVLLGDRSVEAGPSDRSGHFRAEFDLDDAFVAAHATRTDSEGCSWLAYSGVVDDDDSADLAIGPGRIQLVAEAGLSVISDIDDTVKVSNVADRRELLRNTLVREFAAVPGMPEAYRRWEQDGTSFHYVSSSPWQLSSCLCGFLAAAGLPAGSMHLKLFRLKDSTPLGRITTRKRSKRRAIEQIMDDFPRRRFVLVGDSGEKDPEVYAAVARRRPEQVAAVLIRRVPVRSAASHTSLRFEKLARRLPAGLLRTFVAAEELQSLPG
jgi:phosphatidate phosphatase APP1